jgi:hypothetical protein
VGSAMSICGVDRASTLSFSGQYVELNTETRVRLPRLGPPRRLSRRISSCTGLSCNVYLALACYILYTIVAWYSGNPCRSNYSIWDVGVHAGGKDEATPERAQEEVRSHGIWLVELCLARASCSSIATGNIWLVYEVALPSTPIGIHNVSS